MNDETHLCIGTGGDEGVIDLSLNCLDCLMRAEVYTDDVPARALDDLGVTGEGAGARGISRVDGGVGLSSGMVCFVNIDDHLLENVGVTRGQNIKQKYFMLNKYCGNLSPDGLLVLDTLSFSAW